MIRSRLNRVPADPYEAAAWWSARRRLGFTSAHDDEAFAAWLADPANGIAWQATEGPMESVGAFAARPELRELREAALAAGAPRSQSFWRWATGGAIAASLVAALTLTLTTLPTPTGQDAPNVQTASSTVRYTTGVGERRTVTLSDGSRIELNTGSVVEVAYAASRRDVRLLDGQALFRVAHDADRPFAVIAGDRRIVATGTEFDVRLNDAGTVAVTLVDGHVRVEPLRRDGIARIIPTIGAETLDPGERLEVANGEVQIAAADIERATSWTKGQIIFRDDLMSDAIAEVNRYSTTRLVVNDPRVANLHVSGAFASGSTENFIAAVTTFYPIEARRESPGVTVLEWREASE